MANDAEKRFNKRWPLTEELAAMTREQLRALKIRYSEAKSGTREHKIFVQVDRILRSAEGTWQRT